MSEVRYHPYGQERWTAGESPTDFGFTSQRAEKSFGLMDYNARYYSPVLGRFVSPDIIIPDPSSSNGLNRYAYVFNNPLRYIDPSGHDPLDNEWEQQFKENHGRDPTDSDRQDRLFSLMFSGSGPDGTWTQEDWDGFYQIRTGKKVNDRTRYFRGTLLWDDRQSGLDRFQENIRRLVGFYEANEEEQFIRALGLIYAGIPYDASVLQALWSSKNGPVDGIFLRETTEGFHPIYFDYHHPNEDIAHHYTGLLVLSYYLTTADAHLINYARDFENAGDIRSGQEGIEHGRIIQLSSAGHYRLPALVETLGNSSRQSHPPTSCLLRGAC